MSQLSNMLLLLLFIIYPYSGHSVDDDTDEAETEKGNDAPWASLLLAFMYEYRSHDSKWASYFKILPNLSEPSSGSGFRAKIGNCFCFPEIPSGFAPEILLHS